MPLVYQSTCSLFRAGSPRRDCRSPAAWRSSFVQQLISHSSTNQIIQTLLFIKKRLPTNVGQTAHDHPTLSYGLFVRITPTRLCLNTFGVSCGQKFLIIVSFGPRDDQLSLASASTTSATAATAPLSITPTITVTTPAEA